MKPRMTTNCLALLSVMLLLLGSFASNARALTCSLQPPSQEQVVNKYTQNDQRYPSISSWANSNKVVVWQSAKAGNGQWDIYSSLNDGPDVRVNTFTGNMRTNPSVAMTSANEYFVVWQSLNQDGNGWGIYGNKLSGSSQASQPDFAINDFTNSNQINPSIACSSTTQGLCVVVWQSLNQDGSGYGIYGKQFRNGDRALPGTEFRVNSDNNNNQQNPRVAFLADGAHFVVTWDHVTDGDGSGIRYKVSSVLQGAPPNGVLPGSDLPANVKTAGNQLRPSVAPIRNSNQFVIAWKSQLGSNTIIARVFNTNGPVTDEINVATVSGTQLGYNSVAPLGAGWIVAWQGSGGIFAKTFDGSKLGAVQQINQIPTGDQPATPMMAQTNPNGVTVVWESSQVDHSGYGIASRSVVCQ